MWIRLINQRAPAPSPTGRAPRENRTGYCTRLRERVVQVVVRLYTVIQKVLHVHGQLRSCIVGPDLGDPGDEATLLKVLSRSAVD